MEGHIKITDFGLSKHGNRARTTCGTAAYLAPEIIIGKIYTKAVDWWSTGLVLYQMLSGYFPFSGDHQAILLKNILQMDVQYPFWFCKEETDVLKTMLQKDPEKRFGQFSILEDFVFRKCSSPKMKYKN